MELQSSVQSVKKDNMDKQAKNRRLDCSIRQFSAKSESMQEYLDKLIFENMTQFELYQDTVKDNNINLNKMRDDLGQFYNQNFEMENINESLEQRLDQLKGQRDLSIKLSRAGVVNELKAMLSDAERNAQKMINL
jgi:cell division septum initiation protein DivIVA